MADSEDITNEPLRDRPEDEGDYTDRPRRRRRDEEDEPYRRRDYDDRFRQRSWLEKELLNTNIVMLVIFGLCCSGIALIFAIIGVLTCQDPEAKQKALILLIISGVIATIGVAVEVLSIAAG